MALRDLIWKYEQITGKSAEHIPITWLKAFFDGYDMTTEKYEYILNEITYNILNLYYGDEEKSMTDAECAGAYNNAIEQVIEIIDNCRKEGYCK